MPAVSGEPFRANAMIEMLGDSISPTTVKHRWSAWIGPTNPAANPADQTTWEDEAGGSFTLRFQWQRVTEGTDDASVIRVRTHLPGGAQIGSTWTPDPGVQTVQTRTIRLDDDPLDLVAGSARAGMLEIVIEVERVGQTFNWGPWDSRGTQTSPPPFVSTANSRWARGYIRGRQRVTGFVLSNVSAGGATPSKLAYPDEVFHRFTMAAQSYAAHTLTLLHRNPSDQQIRSVVATLSSVTRDLNFTGTSGNSRRVDRRPGVAIPYPDVDTPTRIVVVMPIAGTPFGGDQEHVWSDVAPGGGFTRISDSTIRIDTIPMNASISFTRHLQLNDPTFGVIKRVAGDPPSRLDSQQGNIWARVVNSRNEGVNLSGTPLAFSFRDPFGTVRATLSTSTTTQDGEAGWSTANLLFDHPLPNGNWINSISFTDAVGEQATAEHMFVLLAGDVQTTLMASTEGASHFRPGRTLVCDLSITRMDNGERIVPTSADVALIRFTESGQEHFNGTAWVVTGSGAVTWLPMTLHPADSRAYRRTFTSTSGWGHEDILVVGRGMLSGSAFGDHVTVETLGPHNDHGLMFDPTRLL